MENLDQRLRIGMLSTYPPTWCGLATFSAALTRALASQGHQVSVLQVNDGTQPLADARSVRGFLMNGSAESVRRAALLLSANDVAIIQHEFGIFGGPDGEEVLDVVGRITSPIVAVLHTVPQRPTVRQADILVELCDVADLVVVMSECARARLVTSFPAIAERKVVTIPHGARLASAVMSGRQDPPSQPMRLLTWGLIGPGKGIEHVIDALGLLHDLGHPVQYTVTGSTHPKVLAREGTRYRDALVDLARRLDVDHLVRFDERYRGVEELTEHIASFDAVVLPYETREQVTSGVLVDSLAAGRAVIATRFPHAVEMLGDGTGMIVPHADPRSLAVAIHTLASEPGEVARLQRRARAVAPALSWNAVARSYVSAITPVIARHVRSLV